MQKTRLRKYAKLIALMGANVQPGQDVFLNAGLDQPEFVAMVTDELYKAGARKVHVEFSYQPLQKLHVRHQKLKTLSTVDSYEEEKLKFMAEVYPCRVFLVSDDPDGLKGINMEKMNKAAQAKYPITKGYRQQIDGKHQWCIAAVPGAAWAKKVFPGVRTSVAIEKLWEAILSTSRVDEDPIAAWEAHNADLRARCEFLNNLGIDKLVYKSSNGTDLTVGMIPEAVFCGGAEGTDKGVYFNPNIPSEECFISPMKGVAEGIVYSSKPLSYQGQILENFWFRFENGKVVEAHAEKGDEAVQKMINMDEGARYLGECALVPYDSPINQTGILFYNTLFDENACCHFALGKGFQDTIRDCHNKTLDEIHALGVNDSMIHVDFMIGTEDLSIVAKCRDGKEVQIFKDGTWAF
ncbi:MAG: aminopeptidase [Lachnospiraceae bacterium]|nr:aminopeptidase [Lachnospiraceae bacterium]